MNKLAAFGTGYVLLLALAACGGSSIVTPAGDDTAYPPADSGTKDATTGDATTGDDAGLGNDGSTASDGGLVGPVCPSAAPSVGAACVLSGLACEYGTHENGLCNSVFRCGTDLKWAAATTGESCPYPDGGNASACPSTLAEISPGGSCAVGLACEYPQGHCSCVESCGGPPPPQDGGAAPHWVCDSPSTPSCPTPRPHIGSACSPQTDTYCSYSVCCAGTNLNCNDAGYWEGQTLGGGCP